VSHEMHKQMNLALKKSCLVAIPGIKSYYIHKYFQQQWDNDFIYDADIIHNNTDKQLLIVLTTNKCYYSKCL